MDSVGWLIWWWSVLSWITWEAGLGQVAWFELCPASLEMHPLLRSHLRFSPADHASPKVDHPIHRLTESRGDLPFPMRHYAVLFLVFLTVSCSSLPLPVPRVVSRTDKHPAQVLRKAATLQGDPWKNYHRVEVAYQGKWSLLATKIQPVLTDPKFRKSSFEIYQPEQRLVNQVHSGPHGTKRVIRKNQNTEVSFNDERSMDGDAIAAAALVSDAYTIFLFGPSWLNANAHDLHLLKDRTLDQESCNLVAGRLSPGIGSLTEDHFIAWIGKNSGLMKRFQFSLNGLDSTRGADVDVTFSEHWKAKDGSIWPARFIEYIQRPILAKAHDWRMTSLSLDGQRMK